MKPLHIAEDVVPVGQFKTRASQWLRRLRTEGRPLVITQNGRPAAVLVTPEDFDRLSEQARFLAAVEEGLADSAAGRVCDDAEMTGRLHRRYGSPKP